MRGLHPSKPSLKLHGMRSLQWPFFVAEPAGGQRRQDARVATGSSGGSGGGLPGPGVSVAGEPRPGSITSFEEYMEALAGQPSLQELLNGPVGIESAAVQLRQGTVAGMAGVSVAVGRDVEDWGMELLDPEDLAM